MKKNQYIIPEVTVRTLLGGMVMLMGSGSNPQPGQAPARTSSPVRNTLIVK